MKTTDQSLREAVQFLKARLAGAYDEFHPSAGKAASATTSSPYVMRLTEQVMT
ncbi:MAG TPA: hypothetical protein VGN53_13320 [Klebsiella sp.]|jgi:hypothetical protein